MRLMRVGKEEWISVDKVIFIERSPVAGYGTRVYVAITATGNHYYNLAIPPSIVAEYIEQNLTRWPQHWEELIEKEVTE